MEQRSRHSSKEKLKTQINNTVVQIFKHLKMPFSTYVSYCIFCYINQSINETKYTVYELKMTKNILLIK